MTLSQVSSLERQAAAEKPTSLLTEWRFLHERIGANLETAVTPDTKIATFTGTTFPTIAATFRNIETEKGYDTVIRLATVPTLYNKTEYHLVTPTPPSAGPIRYDAWPSNSNLKFTHTVTDSLEDGIIWQAPCPHPGGAASGCIVGVLVFVHLSDGRSSMEEVFLFRVNED